MGLAFWETALSVGVFGAVLFGAFASGPKTGVLARILGSRYLLPENGRAETPAWRGKAARMLAAFRGELRYVPLVAAVAACMWWLFTGSLGGALGVGGGVMILPVALAGVYRRAKHSAVVSGLEGACVVIATALRSGHELIGALEAAVKYARPPLKQELEEVVAKVQLNMPLDRAFAEFAAKWPSQETRLLSYAISLAQRVGGSAVPRTILSVTDSVRERFQQEHMIKAKTTYQRISGIVISLVPIWCVGVMYLFSPGFFASLFADPGNRVWLIVGLVFLILGWILSFTMVRPEEF